MTPLNCQDDFFTSVCEQAYMNLTVGWLTLALIGLLRPKLLSAIFTIHPLTLTERGRLKLSNKRYLISEKALWNVKHTTVMWPLIYWTVVNTMKSCNQFLSNNSLPFRPVWKWHQNLQRSIHKLRHTLRGRRGSMKCDIVWQVGRGILNFVPSHIKKIVLRRYYKCQPNWNNSIEKHWTLSIAHWKT